MLAAWGAAGPLLPQIGAARRAAHRPVAGYLLVDSLLPQPGSRTREDLRAAQLGDEAAERDAAPPARESPPEFYTEQLPMAADWPDAPCGYLNTGAGPAACARLARMRGWPVLDRSEAAPRTGGAGAAALADDLLELVGML
ncbi:hypothetical protein [Streptomonospora litoralis]|uniref:Uncharacterized protein n=1 Tax=Streptomonospora litoralis TaxID=2498135 RepID=A0A4P6QAH3_9ACTN|nr:hypothetical protein [Streptomonospora litoralis]QBI56529.1 hypothetical protein EKD16_23915 [Streptomonospora litoralis]